VVVALPATDGLGATREDRPSSEPSNARLLTRAEGREVVHLALRHVTAGQSPDCSHLVHEILSDAGLSYPYATSFEIFAGIPQFQRVRRAQPGDLIVWPGHVGLVVDPRATTFFSSTGSGPRTDEYSSDYWRHRGYPRFYRYLVAGTIQLAAHRTTAHRTPEEHRVKPSAQAEIKMRASAEPAGSDEQQSEGPPEISADDTSPAAESYEIPKSIQVVTEHDRPTKDDLERAISELTKASPSASAMEAAKRRSMWVVFVRDWKIDKVKLQADSGWVQLRLRSSGERGPDGTWKKARAQKLVCKVRRAESGWQLFTPVDRLYVSDQSR
jgi:hypothetical protein